MTKQNQTLKHELDTLRKKLEASESKDSIAKEEYDRVVDKFGKIKEALLKERDKASLAEERAVSSIYLNGFAIVRGALITHLAESGDHRWKGFFQ